MIFTNKRPPNIGVRNDLLDLAESGAMENDIISFYLMGMGLKKAYRGQSKEILHKLERAFVSSDIRETQYLAASGNTLVLEVLLRRKAVHVNVKASIIEDVRTDPLILRPALDAIEDRETNPVVKNILKMAFDNRTSVLLNSEPVTTQGSAEK